MALPGLTPEQVADRQHGIGGSDAGAVMGVDPFTTPLKLYLQKVGELKADPPNAAMKRGTFLEPIARKLYCELTGRKVRGMRQQRHAAYPWMTCNVDGVILGDRRGRGVLEIKCPAVWSFAKAKREGLPLRWSAQLQHNLEVTGCQWGSFALFNADLWEMIYFDQDLDRKFVNVLIERERKFWQEHVQRHIPPPDELLPPAVAAVLKGLEKENPGTLIVRNDPEWAEAARVYTEAHELATSAKGLLSTAEERVKELMGGKGAVDGAGLRVYWKDQPGRVTLDRGALEAAHPTLDLTPFEKHGKPYATFRTFAVHAGIGD